MRSSVIAVVAALCSSALAAPLWSSPDAYTINKEREALWSSPDAYTINKEREAEAEPLWSSPDAYTINKEKRGACKGCWKAAVEEEDEEVSE